VRVSDNELQDDDGNVIARFTSHWGACAAMLGEERYVVTCFDWRDQKIKIIGPFFRTRELAEGFMSRQMYDDMRVIPERQIPWLENKSP